MLLQWLPWECGQTYGELLCHRCGMMYTDKYVHAVVVCDEMALLREDFYAHVRHTFDNQVYNELCSGSDERKLQTLISLNDYSLY